MSVVNFAMEDVWDPPAPPPEPPQRRPNVRALVRRWLAALALVAALGGAGWAAVEHYQTHVAAEQALNAAKRYVLRLTDIDAGNVDANFAGIADGSIGEFKGMHTRSGGKLRQALLDNKATARGHVTEAVVKTASRDRVVVVLLVNQAVSNKDHPEPVIDRSRIRMTMAKLDGRWLASKVELL